ncbi:MAG: hypothetical protein IPK68_16915 [Bdellovibrionales bacterium]|nr:hypothetical protein [Bdellovibrionales bacterium]
MMDGDTREGLERFLNFLKKEKEKDKGQEVGDFLAGEEVENPTEFGGLEGDLEESSPTSSLTSSRKKSHPPSIKTMKNCMIFLYEKAKTTEDDLHLKGLYFDKAA